VLTSRLPWGWGAALLLVLGPTPAFAETNTAALAAQLARMRREVETLSTTLESKKADHRARMRSLATQRAELEIQIEREQLRLKQLKQRESDLHARVQQHADRQKELAPAVRSGAATITEVIKAGLPFKRKQRIREFQQIVTQMDRGLITPEEAVARLWDRIEDERRLATQSGLYRQVVVTDGKEHLVEVARIGMVMLFFKTEDDRYGLARWQHDDWHFVMLDGHEQGTAVAGLFDAFRKQIRTGWFELPATLPPALVARESQR